jgi:hypothetical protein
MTFSCMIGRSHILKQLTNAMKHTVITLFFLDPINKRETPYLRIMHTLIYLSRGDMTFTKGH